jgi:GNAT superfamily N-acetyltransferase
MSLIIREATATDAAIVMTLVRELAEFERLSHEVVGDEAMLREALSAGHSAALLAEVDGLPIGLALYFHNFSTFLARRGIYLEDLYVKPAFRKHGVGRALLRRLARLAVDRGCGRFEWAVLDWNVDALRFYESLGARPIKEWIICRLTGEPLRALANEE